MLGILVAAFAAASTPTALECPFQVSVRLVADPPVEVEFDGMTVAIPRWTLVIRQKLHQQGPDVVSGPAVVTVGDGTRRFTMDDYTIWERGGEFTILGGPFGGLVGTRCTLMSQR